MKSFIRRFFLGGVVSLIGVGAALAHHSVTEYNLAKTIMLKGTVEWVNWTNPHSYLNLAVPNDSGGVDNWVLEFGTPGNLARMGWRKDSLKPGDTVTASLHPKRDGSHGGALRSATFADGRELRSPAFYFEIDEKTGQPIIDKVPGKPSGAPTPGADSASPAP